MPTDSECECDLVSKEWLLAKLRSDERDTVLIDCRGSNEYSVSHIRSAVNFSIPSIMLRRLAAGKIELASTVQCKELKARIQHCRTRGIFVLYGDGARDPDSVHGILLKRLKQDGVQVVCLEGKYCICLTILTLLTCRYYCWLLNLVMLTQNVWFQAFVAFKNSDLCNCCLNIFNVTINRINK